MPVLQSFYLSHQWLRELKRGGANTFVGVYFEIDSKTKVYAGRYNQDHKHIELGEAIREIQALEDPLGYEIIIDRKIKASEINKIKNLPQNIGWRYKPDAKGLKPCGCSYCTRGQIKGNRIKQKDSSPEKKSYKTILEELQSENDILQIENLLRCISSKTRRGNPKELLFLLEKNDASIDQEIALTLRVYRHKDTKPILTSLLDKEDDATRTFAAESLLALYGQEMTRFLESRNDTAIQEALKTWTDKQ